MAIFFKVVIRFKNDKTEQEVIFKVGDFENEEEDDHIFFYLEEEQEIEQYIGKAGENGAEDFIVISYEKTNFYDEYLN